MKCSPWIPAIGCSGPLIFSMSNLIRPALAAFMLLSVIFSAHTVSAAPSVAVNVTGLEDPLKTNVLNSLEILQKKDSKDLTVRWLKRMHEQAPEQIRIALQPYGYYNPVIEATLTENEGTWTADYNVAPGPPVLYSKIDVQWEGEGASEPVFQRSLTKFREQFTGRLIHEKYEAAKTEFLNLALAQGYPKAHIIKSEILVDMEKNTADVNLHMDTGLLYFFGTVRFKQDFLDQDLLSSYVTIHPGEPYAYDALIAFQQNLLASEYAREVTLDPQFDAAVGQQVPIDVYMKPILPHKLSFGLGYQTDIGIRGSARWENRLVNRYGHQSDMIIKLAQKERTLMGQYSIPVVRPLTDRWVTTARYDYEETPTSTSDTAQLETAFVRRNLEDTMFYKGYILRSYETFTIGHQPGQTTNLLVFGGTYRFSVIEDSLFPQNGHSLFVDLRGSGEALVSDTSFSRIHAKGRYLLGIGKKIRLDTRMEIGGAWVDDFTKYPASLRYFAGGDNSVRGYTYQSLGPTDDEGIVEGGKQVFTCSFEYDQRVAESWVLAGFVDAGNAYNDTLDKLYVGSGVGFRWLAPFGSLRLDIALPVSEEHDLSDIVYHVGFGATL